MNHFDSNHFDSIESFLERRMQNNHFISEFIKYSQANNLFSEGQKICVAVSGGIDSVVLLHVFTVIKDQFALELCAAHLNHQLRGAESDEDEKFVIDLCSEWHVPVFVEKRDIKEFQQKTKCSVETAARQVRYQFFEDVRQSTGCDKVALAHNANDQAETVLDRLTRGAGISGLKGMPIKRKNFIRPLLFAARRQIAEYAGEMHLHFKEDSTNRDLTFKRNRIRHKLLPLLESDFNPNIVRGLNRLAKIMQETEQVLISSANQALTECLKHHDKSKIILDIHRFFVYFSMIQRYMLQECVHRLGYNPQIIDYQTFHKIRELLKQKKTGKSIQVDHLSIYLTSDEIILGNTEASTSTIPIQQIPGQYELWDGLIFEIKRDNVPLEQVLKNKDRQIGWVDADLITQPLVIRTYQRGDRFFPLNFHGSKKLSDFFTDTKVRFFARPRIPVLSCKTGIVWICGMRLDDRFKVTEKTKRLFKIKLSPSIEKFSFRVGKDSL